MSNDQIKTTPVELPRVIDPGAVWDGKCGKCGAEGNRHRACWRCGMHAGVEYPAAARQTTVPRRIDTAPRDGRRLLAFGPVEITAAGRRSANVR
jgi:hypothetical protein